jgi:hypothetical protein
VPKIINLLGQKFGKLTVVRFAGRNHGKSRNVSWECLCDCGNTTVTSSGHLRSGNTESCGCGKGKFTHGQSRVNDGVGTPEYETWRHMISRCNSVSCTGYENYGGRGIKVCDRWLESFENFLADMGEKPSPKHSIDRINNDGNYEPSNCRWATKQEQDTNRRTNRKYTLNGETLCVTEWAKRLGVHSQTIFNRIDTYGWTIEEALTLPKSSKPTCRIKDRE